MHSGVTPVGIAICSFFGFVENAGYDSRLDFLSRLFIDVSVLGLDRPGKIYFFNLDKAEKISLGLRMQNFPSIHRRMSNKLQR